MAATFKRFFDSDVARTVSKLHEAIPITGTIVSGTYTESGDGTNIKNYAHGMFQSVYDYPYLSSSANHIFDTTVGYSANSGLSGSASVQNTKKINIYNQMAQILVEKDVNGNIQEFDQDGNISAGGTKMQECVFISLARLLTKDEVKKQSFSLQVLTGGANSAPSDIETVSDYNALTEYKVNSPAGEYGLLYTSSTGITTSSAVGHLYYQAGIAVLTASVFDGEFGPMNVSIGTASINQVLTGGTIESSSTGLRNRWYNLDFNNTTELNSSIYFCRANSNEFNYSSNPTYLSGSKLVVKNDFDDTPVSYVTSIGLYNDKNELLAVAKLSEALKKDPTNELTLRVRLDY